MLYYVTSLVILGIHALNMYIMYIYKYVYLPHE